LFRTTIFQLPSWIWKFPYTLKLVFPSTNARALYIPTGPEERSVRLPHSPSGVTTYRESTIFPSGLVSFVMLNLAVGPCQEVSGLLQGSSVAPEDCCGMDVAAIVAGTLVTSAGSIVKAGRGVVVGGENSVAVSIGGMDVAVTVSVFWIFCALIGGDACVLQALTNRTRRNPTSLAILLISLPF
jgi:hypothetical protein